MSSGVPIRVFFRHLFQRQLHVVMDGEIGRDLFDLTPDHLFVPRATTVKTNPPHELVRVTAQLEGAGFDRGHPFLHLFDPSAPRHPAPRMLGDALKRFPHVPARDDRRSPGRIGLRLERDVLEPVEVALERDVVLKKQGLENVEFFIRHPPAFVIRDFTGVELRPVTADAEAQDDPALARVVQRGDQVRQMDRMTHRKQQDRRTQANPLRDRTEGGQDQGGLEGSPSCRRRRSGPAERGSGQPPRLNQSPGPRPRGRAFAGGRTGRRGSRHWGAGVRNGGRLRWPRKSPPRCAPDGFRPIIQNPSREVGSEISR